jgi:hypothetical protein
MVVKTAQRKKNDFFQMPTSYSCCDGNCLYCKSMNYTWPSVQRTTGYSKSNYRKHMLLHPCCKKISKAAVIYPLLNRTLIVNALSMELQARIRLKFGENPPLTHPFPRQIESWLEVQLHIERALQVFNFNPRISTLTSLCLNKVMMVPLGWTMKLLL